MSAVDPDLILGALDLRLCRDDADEVREALAESCRGSLAEFIRHGWHVLDPSTPLAWNWHIDAIADHVQAAIEGWARKQDDPEAETPFQNLLINVPPGTGKSRIVSVMAPAWIWTRWPAWRGIFLSANPRVAIRDSLYTRDLIESGWYQNLFRPTWTMSRDQKAKSLFRNTAGGSRQAMGITAKIIGDRADALFIDDPHDPEEVLSEVMRTAITDRWDSGIANRVNDLRSSVRIGIMQRLHELDWSGHVLNQGGWEHLCIAQEFEPDRAAVSAIGWTDPRSEDGDLLFPERFPAEVLDKEKKRLGPYGYAGQHQQRPAPREGGMFQAGWFPVVDAAPANLTLVRYWDKAGAKPGRGDWTCGVLMGRSEDGRFYILHVKRGQWPPDERNKEMRATAEMDDQRYGRGKVRIFVEQEPGAGSESTATVVRFLAGYNVQANLARGQKEENAEGLSAQCRAGNVFMLRDPSWNAPYLAVMCGFPTAAHDDDVDASSGAFNKLALIGPPRVAPGSAAIPRPPQPPLPVGY